VPAVVAHVRSRLARQLSDQHAGPDGVIPLLALSPEWEAAFAESMIGPAEDRQLALAPSRMTEFLQRLRTQLDLATAAGAVPVLLCSGAVRGPLRAIIERVRPQLSVLAQGEISSRARIRTLAQV